MLQRFVDGSGMLYDLEFLEGKNVSGLMSYKLV